MKPQNQLKLLIIQFLLAVILGLYTVLKTRGAPVFLFWPLFLSLVLVSLIIVLVSDKPHKLISLLILEVALCSVYILSFPYPFQLGRDVYFESGFASTIVDKGVWNPTLGTGFAENYYGYNPSLHFLLAFLSTITGISTPIISKYIILPAFRLLLVFSAIMIISLFIRKEKSRIVYLAALLFIASFGMSFIDVSRRLVASIFLMLAFYSLIKSYAGQDKKTRRIWGALFYLFSAMIIISNHSVAYLFMLLLLSIWLFWSFVWPMISRRFFENKRLIAENYISDENYNGILLKFMVFIGLFLLWEALNSFVLLKNDLLYLESLFGILVGGEGLRLLFGAGSPVASPFIYRWYETFALYLYHILFVLLSIFGLAHYTKKILREPYDEMRSTNKAILLFMGFFSIAMYVVAFMLIRTYLDSAAYTFLWFFCIPLTIFLAYFIDHLYIRVIDKMKFLLFLLFVLALLFVGHVFSGIYTPRLVGRLPTENIVLGTDMRAKVPELYYSAQWLSANSHKNSRLLGDMNAFEIYSGLFGFDVSIDEYNLRNAYGGTALQLEETLSSDNVYFGSYSHTYHNGRIDYMIIDSRYYSTSSYLFDKPLFPSKSEKFGDTTNASKIYDNGVIGIYRNLFLKI